MNDKEFDNSSEKGAPINGGLASSENLPESLEDSARAACDTGDEVLGMHLYLAAFEQASQDSYPPSSEALDMLRSAWDLAVSLKERSMAEYIFEKIEPFLSGPEMGEFADELQDLAFSKLEQLGLSREELEDMASSITGGFFEPPASVRIEQFRIPGPFGVGKSEAELAVEDEDRRFLDELDLVNDDEEDVDSANALDGSSTSDDAMSEEELSLLADDIDASENNTGVTSGADAHGIVSANDADVAASMDGDIARETYEDLAGFEKAIDLMRSFGIGMKGDEKFDSFIEELNARHGLDRMPALGTLVFHARAREDANKFMEATRNELGLPMIRMTIEEGWQGQTMLVVASEGIDFRNKQNFLRMGFNDPIAFLMEDIDLWSAPNLDESDEKENATAKANISRGIREATHAMRMAVESPNVYVFVSATNVDDIDPFYLDIIEPATVVDIDLPTEEERTSLWRSLMEKHSSLQDINLDDLVRLTEGMPRFDIMQAARESLEEAYKYGLVTRRYAPVSAQNIFEKLAAYQPLESSVYRELEDKVLEDFRQDLDHLGDLLDSDV